MSEGQNGGFPELAGRFFYPEAELRGILLIKNTTYIYNIWDNKFDVK
jgi:hypothetical protein